MRILATFTGAFALGIFLAQYLLPVEWLLPCGAAAFVLAFGRLFLRNDAGRRVLLVGVVFMFSLIVKNDIMLLIIGIMIGYLASATISLLNYFATEEGVKSYVVWGMGNFGGVPMRLLLQYSAVCLLGLIASLLLIKPLHSHGLVTALANMMFPILFLLFDKQCFHTHHLISICHCRVAVMPP